MLYYTVYKNYEGCWGIGSFGGRNKREEREFALTMNAEVAGVFTVFNEARLERNAKVSAKNQQKVS